MPPTLERRERRTVAYPINHADSRVRPLRRRVRMIARPPRVRIRARKPCRLARLRLFGWWVRFTSRLLADPCRHHRYRQHVDKQPLVTTASPAGPCQNCWPAGSHRTGRPRLEVPTSHGRTVDADDANRPADILLPAPLILPRAPGWRPPPFPTAESRARAPSPAAAGRLTPRAQAAVGACDDGGRPASLGDRTRLAAPTPHPPLHRGTPGQRAIPSGRPAGWRRGAGRCRSLRRRR